MITTTMMITITKIYMYDDNDDHDNDGLNDVEYWMLRMTMLRYFVADED